MNMSTNWWKISPYIGLTGSTHLTGVFPTVLRQMVASCCQPCRAHNTTLDFLTAESIKSSLESVRNGVGESDLSFPVYGSSEKESYGALYGYVPVISSPGEAFVVNREMDQTPSDILASVIFSSWPLAVLSLVFCILAGIVIWILVSCVEWGRRFLPDPEEGLTPALQSTAFDLSYFDFIKYFLG